MVASSWALAGPSPGRTGSGAASSAGQGPLMGVLLLARGPAEDQKITAHARAEFLKELALRGNVTGAAEKTPHTRRVWYLLRNRDPEFARLWEEALEEAVERLEREARRRAEAGYERPIYQKGELVGVERQYSDTLMICLLKAHSPKYKERVDLNANVNVTFAELVKKASKETP